MPTIEIDEAVFQQNRELAARVQAMLKHPKAREKVLSAYKDIDPNAVIPEIDAKKPIEDAIGQINQKFDSFIKEQKEERAKEREEAARQEFLSKFESGRNYLRDNYGVTPEGLGKIEELMTEAGIVDHEIGYAAFTKLNPEPEPAPPAPNFGFGGVFNSAGKSPDEFLKSMHASRGLDEAALDKRIHDVLTDVRQQNGAPVQQRPNFGRR